jgi:hypothetical protein
LECVEASVPITVIIPSASQKSVEYGSVRCRRDRIIQKKDLERTGAYLLEQAVPAQA